MQNQEHVDVAKEEQNKQADVLKDQLTENVCPFPEHEGYAAVWAKLTPNQQQDMKANIRISADGKIEMIKMKKKFSMLTAQDNDNDVFDGSYEDHDEDM
jgi:hypothetical protein